MHRRFLVPIFSYHVMKSGGGEFTLSIGGYIGKVGFLHTLTPRLYIML